MYKHLTLDDFLTLAQTSKKIAVYQEIAADCLTPIAIVEKLTEEMQDGVILESGLDHRDLGRYSYIAFGNLAQFSLENQLVTEQSHGKTTTHHGEPFHILRKLLNQHACHSNHDQVNFIQGAVGFITYDAVRLFENIPDRHHQATPLPYAVFNIYQTILMFDHLQQKLLISHRIEIQDAPETSYEEAQQQLAEIIAKITRNKTTTNEVPQRSKSHPEAPEVDVSDEQFIQLIEQAKHHIQLGDAFQIVLSRCFKTAYTVTPLQIYRSLRQITPAPYMFYLPTQHGVVIGASPEKMIVIRDRKISINPIAGTRLRTESTSKEAVCAELLNNKKEMAEHMMLVDLARNDLGAVCEPGSIEIDELLNVKHYSHVSHITSEISGKLRHNLDAFDALAAVFPAGTLSGAPKIRAMEIIDALETSKRGLYGGAICRLDFQGNLDSCIAIRMATLVDGQATVRTGAGIVHDSDPISEANETRLKAKGVLEAIAFAEEHLR